MTITAAIASGIAVLVLTKILAALALLPGNVRHIADDVFALLAVVGLWAGWRRYCRTREQMMLAQKLVRNSPDCMLVLSTQGTILDVNERCRDVLGYNSGELVGNHIRALVHPNERRSITQFLVQVATTNLGVTARMEVRLIHRSQRAFPAELAVTIEQVERKQLILVSIRDVSDRVRQERKIRRVLHTLDRIVRTIPHTIVIYDIEKQRLVYARTLPGDDLGYDARHLTSNPLSELVEQIIHPDDRQKLSEAVTAACTLGDNESVPCIYRGRDSTGQWQWRRIRIAVFERNTDGVPTRLLMVGENITEMIRTRENLDRIHQRLRFAAEGAGIGVWECDLHQGCFVWDSMTYRIHGVPESLTGKQLMTCWRRGIRRRDFQAILDAVKAILRHNSDRADVCYEYFTPCGERKYIRAIAALQSEPATGQRMMVGVVIDETKLRIHEQQQAKFRHLLEESQRMARMASWELDLETMTFSATDEIWHIINIEKPAENPSITLDMIRQVIHPDDWELWWTTISTSVTEAKRHSFRYRVVRQSDKNIRWLECRGEPVIERGRLRSYRGTVQDITEQYEQEQELRRTREEALRASRVKSEFLANMSHEIRTPMNAILGFASLLDQTVTDPLQREYIAAIRSGGQTLLQLINDILDLSKLEAGKMRLQLEPSELRTFIEEVRMFLGERASSKGVELRTELIGTLPTALEIDAVRLRQILFNLIGNAIKFTERGWVTIRVYGSPNGDDTWRMIFEVEDTGIGIPASQLEAIFEAFQQVEGQSTRKYGGTGLGLSICKRLTELMGGTISVRSAVGSGSVFTVVLPSVREVHVDGLLDRSTETLPAVSFDGVTVVVVDDVESNRALLRSYLEYHGAVVHEATDADDAERMIAVVQPMAVFTDIQMPGRSGIELATALRASQMWCNLPLVAVTASPITCEQHAALFDAVLLKPITLEAFLAVSCQVLPHTSSTADAATPEGDQIDDFGELADEHRSVLRRIAEHEWRHALERMTSADIEAFIAALEQSDGGSSPTHFRRYIEQVRRAYDQFDIAGLRQWLKRFPLLVEQKMSGSSQVLQ